MDWALEAPISSMPLSTNVRPRKLPTRPTAAKTPAAAQGIWSWAWLNGSTMISTRVSTEPTCCSSTAALTLECLRPRLTSTGEVPQNSAAASA